MKVEYITTNCVHLSAEDGMYLTQSKDVPIMMRVICHEVMTSVLRMNNWRDCTQAEADEYMRKQEEVEGNGEEHPEP